MAHKATVRERGIAGWVCDLAALARLRRLMVGGIPLPPSPIPPPPLGGARPGASTPARACPPGPTILPTTRPGSWGARTQVVGMLDALVWGSSPRGGGIEATGWQGGGGCGGMARPTTPRPLVTSIALRASQAWCWAYILLVIPTPARGSTPGQACYLSTTPPSPEGHMGLERTRRPLSLAFPLSGVITPGWGCSWLRGAFMGWEWALCVMRAVYACKNPRTWGW